MCLNVIIKRFPLFHKYSRVTFELLIYNNSQNDVFKSRGQGLFLVSRRVAKVTERRETATSIRSRRVQGAKFFGEVRLNVKAWLILVFFYWAKNNRRNNLFEFAGDCGLAWKCWCIPVRFARAKGKQVGIFFHWCASYIHIHIYYIQTCNPVEIYIKSSVLAYSRTIKITFRSRDVFASDLISWIKIQKFIRKRE